MSDNYTWAALSNYDIRNWKWIQGVAVAILLNRGFGYCFDLNWFNTLRPGQNGRHFADDIFKCIFLNENVWIAIKISLKFVPKGPINNIQALVQIMAWRRPGDKQLSEPVMVTLPTHICVTLPEWVNKKRKDKKYDVHLLNVDYILIFIVFSYFMQYKCIWISWNLTF